MPNIGTVYGGYATLNRDGSVTVVAEWSITTVNDYSWTYQSANNRFTASEMLMKQYSNVRECPLYCSAFVPISDKRPAEQVPNNAIYCGTSKNFFIYGTGYTDATAFKEAFKDVQIAFPLATPLTYTLSASVLNSLIGQNNVWTDAGDVSVKAWGF